MSFKLSIGKDYTFIAVPPTIAKRTDCITADNNYHYNCKPGEFKGIEFDIENYITTFKNK